MARRDKDMPLLDGLVGYDAARGVRTEVPPSDESLDFDPFEMPSAPVDEPPPEPPAQPAAKPGDHDNPLTVGAAIRAATTALETRVGAIWVEGEACELKRAASGHVYFGLSDDGAKLDCVMWSSDARRCKFRIENGQRLLCRGSFGIFERSGRLQLYVRAAEPAGLGADALALQQLKDKLAGEGLFDPRRKRTLPPLPRRVGVVTSRTGAAVRDIIRVAHRRFPVAILLAPAQVQGPDAPRQIVAALRAICAHVDVVIVGRGGGGAADLSAFNDERVVRAIAACPVPTVSAVGHEIDTTLADLVADRRAPTPSAAAELVVPVRDDLARALAKEEQRLRRELEHRLRSARQELDTATEALAHRLAVARERGRRALAELERQLGARHPQARLARDRAELRALQARADAALQRALQPRRAAVRELEPALHRAMHGRAAAARRAFEGLAGRLDAMSPLRVLDRGYAIATRDGHALRDAGEAEPGTSLNVRLAAGSLDCRVERVHPPDEGGQAQAPDEQDDQGREGGGARHR